MSLLYPTQVTEDSVDQATNKSELVTKLPKELTLTHNCSTKSRKSCCNKRTSEVVVDMEVTPAVDTEATQVVTESHHHTAHLKSHLNTVHQDTARAALSELNLDTSFRVTKSLNT